jgi:hypothetical protein
MSIGFKRERMSINLLFKNFKTSMKGMPGGGGGGEKKEGGGALGGTVSKVMGMIPGVGEALGGAGKMLGGGGGGGAGKMPGGGGGGEKKEGGGALGGVVDSIKAMGVRMAIDSVVPGAGAIAGTLGIDKTIAKSM